ncbi:MAG: UDP-glucose/GDP-mannose dehydrogenase family protein [Apibacter sp.]|uniref:UDP-glucose dehydrogenase family protein n=1 Tax=Apibacter sp. TaxID=2023709 RepID=UPI0025FBAAA8|nr:UDP-glucose/GDP-mannose dehydrogenase family protein [Apibacter sp.]MCT6868564.1 UDP-glucose/GDP-mannose dehydrogenase family protein [Apibacter sp.]
MNITIVGTGYVGLVSGTCLADLGHSVHCVDINEEKVTMMKNGQVPIYEPQLEEVFLRNIKGGRLFFTTNLSEAMKVSNVIFLALPTPPGEDGSADLSYVLDVAGKIGNLMTDYTLIVNKSTVPVGTSEKVKNLIKSKTQKPFDVVSNPEFLREGYAVEDFMNPERVIVGASSQKAFEIMDKIYLPLTNAGAKLIKMDEKSSELTKYASNSFLATKITFMNEVANYCEKVGADVDRVRLGMGSDERIGNRFLFPGVGYGGSCFPKDVKALLKSGKEVGYTFEILESVEEVNQRQKTILVPEVEKYLGSLKNKQIAIWGLAFKENTDDIREASSLEIIEMLLDKGAKVRAYDSIASKNVKKILGDKIEYAENMYECVEGSDALIIVTEWGEFRNPHFDILEKKMINKAIFDGRNLYNLDELQAQGFYYKSIGRKLIKG